MEAAALYRGKDAKDDGRNEHVHGKETADTVGEQIMDEKSHGNAVLRDPRHELPARKKQAEEAKDKVNMTYFHNLGMLRPNEKEISHGRVSWQTH